MSSTPESGSDTPRPSSLPQVEAPNVRMIIQLFLVPGILVAVVIGFILLFFGGIGGGPQQPNQFIAGLSDPSGHKRNQTAHDLAQILPRKPELRQNVKFALDITELLNREWAQIKAEYANPSLKKSKSPTDEIELIAYLPKAVASFDVPVGITLLESLVQENDGQFSDPQKLSHFRNGLYSIGLLGAQLQEFDRLTTQQQALILDALHSEASEKQGRPQWASLSLQYLKRRLDWLKNKKQAALPDLLAVLPVLRQGARCNDEMSRKFTILALANWYEAGTEELLREMTGPMGQLDILVDSDRERAVREIRYNAALALARRGSSLMPVDLILELLDEAQLRKVYSDPKKDLSIPFLIKALNDLREFKRIDPEGFAKQTQIMAAVAKLKQSPMIAVEMEARKLLGDQTANVPSTSAWTRQLTLIIGMTVGVLFLLGLAVYARMKRATGPLT